MDGNLNRYDKVQEGKNWYGLGGSSSKLLPYPVVSELRVAFMWRKQSIKHEAKMDEATIKKKREFERVDKVLRGELEKVMPLDYKSIFDESNKESLRKWKQNDTLYRAKFVDAVASQKEDMLRQVEGMTGAWEDKQVIKLRAVVDKREAEMLKVFDRLRAEEIRAARATAQPEPKSKEKPAEAKAAKEKPAEAKPAKEKVEAKPVKEKVAKEKPAKEKAENPAKEKAEKPAKEKQPKEKSEKK
jgi:colicin import membrane protein